RAITLIGVSGLIAAISAEKRPLSGKNGTFPRAERPSRLVASISISAVENLRATNTATLNFYSTSL
ncbi:hypothetical protein, partial [Staphylococcus aureus]|uniref:hypothetical protein n=1 Tax=Staphylococcus aureus TaxID=1280 RepID=UPI0038B38637